MSEPAIIKFLRHYFFIIDLNTFTGLMPCSN